MSFPSTRDQARAGLIFLHASTSVVTAATDFLNKALKAVTPDKIKSDRLAGDPIEHKLDRAPGNDQPIGGIKVSTKNGWFAARPSGTEAVYKIYGESFVSADHLKAIQRDAQALVDGLV